MANSLRVAGGVKEWLYALGLFRPLRMAFKKRYPHVPRQELDSDTWTSISGRKTKNLITSNDPTRQDISRSRSFLLSALPPDIYRMLVFFLHLFLLEVFLSLQSYWSLSCDHGLH